MSAAKYFKIVLGLLIMAVGAYGCVYFWPHLVHLLKGAVGPCVILFGLLVVAIGAMD